MDPSHVRRAANEALLANSSFETVAREWFAKKSPGWAPSHSSKIIRLAKRALEIFSELLPVTGNCQYVFPGIRTSEGPMSENTVNAALRRLGYSGGEMTGHGFRSMVSTLLNEQGWSPDEIERMLSHVVKNTWPKNRALRQA
jgi:integrase